MRGHCLIRRLDLVRHPAYRQQQHMSVCGTFGRALLFGSSESPVPLPSMRTRNTQGLTRAVIQEWRDVRLLFLLAAADMSDLSRCGPSGTDSIPLRITGCSSTWD